MFDFFLAKNRLNIHNQLCIALLETPPCATSMYLMALEEILYSITADSRPGS